MRQKYLLLVRQARLASRAFWVMPGAMGRSEFVSFETSKNSAVALYSEKNNGMGLLYLYSRTEFLSWSLCVFDSKFRTIQIDTDWKQKT